MAIEWKKLAYEDSVVSLIADHKALAAAHHARYTDAEARGSVPAGSIMIWPTGTPPSFWLECDGSARDRSVDTALFAVIGVMYGDGDGSTTFNLPNFKGMFLRGVDHGAGFDPDAATRTDRGDSTTGDHVGTKQADDLISHYHGIWLAPDVQSGTGRYRAYGSDQGAGTVNTTSRGGNETRPVNVNVMYIIKY